MQKNNWHKIEGMPKQAAYFCGIKAGYPSKRHDGSPLQTGDIFRDNSDTYFEYVSPVSGDDWHARGELPPVGVECEYYWCERPATWLSGIIVSEGMDEECKCVCIKVGDQLRINSYSADFRPLKTERERAIEEALKIVASKNDNYDCVAALYDAGYRKVGE